MQRITKHSPRSLRACALVGDESLSRFSLAMSCDVPLSLGTSPVHVLFSVNLSPFLGSPQAPSPWLMPNPACVQVRLLWDVLTPDPNSCPPLYVLWRVHSQIPQRVAWPGPVPASLSLDLLESVLRYVGLNEVHKAVGLLLETLGPPPTGLHLQRGIYREILFLTMAAMGKDHRDIGEFDKKYKAAFNKLANSMGKEELRQRRAQMPTPKAINCRKYFGAPLEC
ncbi:DENN domain-containing protein 4B [Pteropus alecto]|uniref:DENN domain-containing protein 4B n=2 Tax=Pteropus alecto TaxID=9402 RepID=L5JTQ4_PTEAL|nr:DENN domain-containing protein 4B [Pteropus alecto]